MKMLWIRLRFTVDRISCSCVPSPQSNRNTSPSRTTAVAERPRVSVGMAELVPSRTIFIGQKMPLKRNRPIEGFLSSVLPNMHTNRDQRECTHGADDRQLRSYRADPPARQAAFEIRIPTQEPSVLESNDRLPE